ncbi:acetyltransferase-like isoleucine patch superfamily enzyme [Pedobacter sp. UYP24]
MTGVINIIKGNPTFKKIVHRLLIPKNEARPRIWVKWFLNPFFHNRGSGSKIRFNVRLDVLPFNKFTLGSNSVIEDFCTINNGVGNVFIGNDSLIGIGNTIIGPVHIGNNIIIAQNVVVSGLNHIYLEIDIPISKQPIVSKQIIIEDDCWIAANSVITAGVTIGKHSIVAAGSVVTKDVPPYSVVAGNPATLLKAYNFETKTWERIY